MKLIKKSVAYMFKNFLYIFLMGLIAIAFFGILSSPFKLFEFMNIYSTLPVINFSTIFNALLDFNWLSVILSILGIVILSISISMIIGQMENHMRSGKLNIKGTFSYVNNNILVVLFNFVILAIIYFVLSFLASAVLFLLHLMISGLQSTPTVLNIVISIIFASGFFVLYLQIAGVFMLNIPNMTINGYNLKQSISSTISLLNKHSFAYFCALLLPFVIIIPLVSVLIHFNLSILSNIMGVLLITMYYPSVIMVTYFELTDTPRYDNRKYYNYK